MVLNEFTQRKIENFVVFFGAALRIRGRKGVELLLTLLSLRSAECCQKTVMERKDRGVLPVPTMGGWREHEGQPSRLA